MTLTLKKNAVKEEKKVIEPIFSHQDLYFIKVHLFLKTDIFLTTLKFVNCPQACSHFVCYLCYCDEFDIH